MGLSKAGLLSWAIPFRAGLAAFGGDNRRGVRGVELFLTEFQGNRFQSVRIGNTGVD